MYCRIILSLRNTHLHTCTSLFATIYTISCLRSTVTYPMYCAHPKRYQSSFCTQRNTKHQTSHVHQMFGLEGSLISNRCRIEPQRSQWLPPPCKQVVGLLNLRCVYVSNRIARSYISSLPSRGKTKIRSHSREKIHAWRKSRKPHTLKPILT